MMQFVTELKGASPQPFPTPCEAMTELLGTEGEADVYVESDGERVGHLLHRDAAGSWSSAERRNPGLMKRPVFIISTKATSKEQLKAEAREALRKYRAAQ
jgi:hypothetical protein